jgi:hypothetical protein
LQERVELNAGKTYDGPKMQIEKLLAEPAFRFPPRRRPKQDIRDYLRDTFTELAQALNSVTEPDKYLERACDRMALSRATAESILTVIDQSLSGNQAGAYSTLNRLIRPLEEDLQFLSKASRSGLTYKDLNQPGFFRARTMTGPIRPNRGDLFHVPFEQREKLSSQRYSVPGVPTLYLGSSAYVCWEELGRPEFGSTYISHFRARDERKIRLLVIGPAPAQLRRRIIHQFNSPPVLPGCEDIYRGAAASLAICWPLIEACSMLVLERDSPFVPEYVVPQLVLQWVLNSGAADGVEYPSMLVDHDQVWSDFGFNYAFPARSSGKSGFCETLADLFEMTDPVPWSFALAFRDAPKRTAFLLWDLLLRFRPGRWRANGLSKE